MVFTTLPGVPKTTEKGGMTVPLVTTAPAPTMDPLPMTAPSKIMAPIPIKQ